MQALVDLGGLARSHCGHRPDPEGAAHNGGVGEQGLALRDEQVKTGGDESADRVWHRDLGAGPEADLAAAVLQQAAILEEAHELLGEQRVAA